MEIINEVISLLLTAAIAYAGGKLGEKLKLPSGAMTGSLITVTLLNIIAGKVFFTPFLRLVMMVLSGFTIGAAIKREDIAAMPSLIVPIIIVITMMAGYTSGMGILTSKVAGLDLPTAMFCFVPGGVADMAAISESLGSDTAKVSILQMWRLLNIFIVIPPVFRLVSGVKGKGERKTDKSKKTYNWKNIMAAIVCACAGAFIINLFGMSSGIIIGAVLGACIYSTAYKKVEYPDWIKFVSKLLSGVYLGSQMTLEVIKDIGTLIVPALMMSAAMLALVFISAYLMSLLTKFDFKFGLIASTPGGLQEMFFLAEDIGTDAPKTAVVQTARLLGIYLLFPPIIEFIVKVLL